MPFKNLNAIAYHPASIKNSFFLLALITLFISACGNELEFNKVPASSAVSVSTLAGSGAQGSVNSTGIYATFYEPTGVAVDALGNVYVADYRNNLIRKISITAAVTTFAGSTEGFANGAGTYALFNQPTGVAVDGAGNIYVADNINHLIREIGPAGVVTTLAGSGARGNTNGPAAGASFNYPQGVAVDATGNVYVADYGNNLIRKISTAGLVTTLAGKDPAGANNGVDTAATFNQPTGVAVDAAGNVYVADEGNNLIREISPAGVVSTFAGSGAPGAGNGTGTNASFNGPTGVAVDASGNVYVADYGNNMVREISPAGAVTTLGVSGTSTSKLFKGPYGVAVDAAGNVYVADYGYNMILKISK
ncbi:NHL repeat-containing protein [Mucilaginibacter sp.]|uniref:NHL repeat-containing protein n=1 Tax=Mucilaginibacter sp. TaxID=1882438 RepID=UPI002850E2F8|nr:NHL repeat-containing protein [Mucilaginibacter sp.]MDR3697507.1 NHL repeat-containing protein [Mucilaginibacter sp.]